MAISEAPGDRQLNLITHAHTHWWELKGHHEETAYDEVMIYHSSRIFSDLSERPLSIEVEAGDLLLKSQIDYFPTWKVHIDNLIYLYNHI